MLHSSNALMYARKAILGQGPDGWRQVQQLYKGRDRQQYFSQLRRFLQDTEYIQNALTRGQTR